MKKIWLLFVVLSAVALSGCKAEKTTTETEPVSEVIEEEHDESETELSVKTMGYEVNDRELYIYYQTDVPLEYGGAEFERSEVLAPNEPKAKYTEESFFIGTDGKTRAYGVKCVFEASVPNGKYSIRLENLGEYNGDFEKILKGVWVTDCAVDYPSAAYKIRYFYGDTVTVKDSGENTNTQAVLISCEADKNGIVLKYKSEDLLSLGEVSVGLKNGNDMELSGFCDINCSYNADTGESVMTIKPRYTLNISDVRSVRFCGKRFYFNGTE